MRIIDYLISEDKENVKAGLRLLLWGSENLEKKIEQVMFHPLNLVWIMLKFLCVPEKYYINHINFCYVSNYILYYLRGEPIYLKTIEPINELLYNKESCLYNIIDFISVFKLNVAVTSNNEDKPIYYYKITFKEFKTQEERNENNGLFAK